MCLNLQIITSVVKEVSGVEAGNLQSLTQVTSVIARATLEPSEVTFDTQVGVQVFIQQVTLRDSDEIICALPT